MECFICTGFDTPAHTWPECPRLQGDLYGWEWRTGGLECQAMTGRGRCFEVLRSDGTCPADYRHRVNLGE